MVSSRRVGTSSACGTFATPVVNKGKNYHSAILSISQREIKRDFGRLPKLMEISAANLPHSLFSKEGRYTNVILAGVKRPKELGRSGYYVIPPVAVDTVVLFLPTHQILQAPPVSSG